LSINVERGCIMKSEYISSGVGAAHATQWTLVISAAQSQVEGGRAALAVLCQVYWYPLYSFARLVASFQIHLSVEAHRARSLKRGGKCEFVSLDLKSAENRYRLEPADHLSTLIHRLRKRYSAYLRQEVGRTVSDPAAIDGEIHALCDALIAAEGQIVP
jgi:hypothetical protein